MSALLDTHALLWWLTDDSRLGKTARELIRSDKVLVSVVSLWEIEIKRALGRLAADLQEIKRYVDTTGSFSWLPLAPEHVMELKQLPLLHSDPFDRILLAQAVSEQATFITRDAAFRAYGVNVDW